MTTGFKEMSGVDANDSDTKTIGVIMGYSFSSYSDKSAKGDTLRQIFVFIPLF